MSIKKSALKWVNSKQEVMNQKTTSNVKHSLIQKVEPTKKEEKPLQVASSVAPPKEVKAKAPTSNDFLALDFPSLL